MADFVTGREIIAGLKKASTWRTAVSLGSNDGLLILSEAIGAKAPTYVPDDSLGQSDIMDYYKVNEAITGANITGYLRYDMWDVALALALGEAGTPTQVDGDAYSNTYKPADNIDGYFATFAIKKANTTKGIWEIPSAKITGFTITARIGELARITVNMMGNKIETESPTNTSLSSVTYRDRGNVCRMDTSFKIRMNSQSGSALADTDKIYPFGFTLTYNRPFQENFEASYTDMSEPVQNGFAEATLELNFDKYNLDTFMSAIENETDYKMDIVFEGETISGSTNYTFRIDIPKITWVTGEAPVGGPGTISHTVTGRLQKVESAPTGMTGVLGPLAIYVVNKRTSDPLA